MTSWTCGSVHGGVDSCSGSNNNSDCNDIDEEIERREDASNASRESSSSMKTPSSENDHSQADLMIVDKYGNSHAHTLVATREWRQFLQQWNQPILRITVAECVPDLVGILWHPQFIDLTTPASSNEGYPLSGHQRIIISRADKEATVLTRQLLYAILQRTRITAAALLLALFFAHRYRCYQGECGPPGSQFHLFLVALLLAHKYTEDHPFSNRVWAQLTELPIASINALERDFLKKIEHQLAVRLRDFQHWVVALNRRFGWTLMTSERRQDYRTLPLPPTPEVPAISVPKPVKIREHNGHGSGLHREAVRLQRPSAVGRRNSTILHL